MEKSNICLIVGPTAVGKSDVGLTIAREFSGEIINCDSMQLYQGLDIGTAKPLPAAMEEIPHHLFDVAPPGESMNAMLYADSARQVVDEVVSRQHLPVVVGGTGLYIKALLEDFCEVGPIVPEVRQGLAALERERGLPYLFDQLQRVDQETAKRIQPNDAVRVRRALEVYEMTGEPLSQIQKCHSKGKRRYRALKIGLTMDRQRLYLKINNRVQRMFNEGLLEEVDLFPEGKETGIGYVEARLVKRGELTVDQAVAKVAQKTRNYAKRQMTWFRKDPEIQWFDPTTSGTMKQINDQVRRFLDDEEPSGL